MCVQPFMPLIFLATKHTVKASMCSLGPTPGPPYLCVIVIDLWQKSYLRILGEVSSKGKPY